MQAPNGRLAKGKQQHNEAEQRWLAKCQQARTQRKSARPPARPPIRPSARPSARPPGPGPAEPIYINSRSTAKRLLLVALMLHHVQFPFQLMWALGTRGPTRCGYQPCGAFNQTQSGTCGSPPRRRLTGHTFPIFPRGVGSGLVGHSRGGGGAYSAMQSNYRLGSVGLLRGGGRLATRFNPSHAVWARALWGTPAAVGVLGPLAFQFKYRLGCVGPLRGGGGLATIINPSHAVWA